VYDEAFARAVSGVHRLDPRARLAGAAIFSLAVALARRPDTGALALVLGAALVLAARLPLGLVLRRLAAVNAFTAFLWIFLPFSADGEVVFTLGPLAATVPGLLLAGTITLKCNAIVCALMALVSTVPASDMGRALRGLGAPASLSHLFLFTYRFVHVIARERTRLSWAMKIRGFNPGTNLHTYKAYASLVGMVLVRSWERAERVHRAMLCRGFQGTFHSLNELRMGPADMAFLGLTLTASLALAMRDLLT